MSPKIDTQKELAAENQSVSSFWGASGGNRTRTDISVQGIFLPLWLSPPFVCGPDYSFTMTSVLGVSCLVSAPSSVFRRLGSRLPSALPVKASLNLRHSTSLFSERALKLCLSPSCLPFHHQGLCKQVITTCSGRAGPCQVESRRQTCMGRYRAGFVQRYEFF